MHRGHAGRLRGAVMCNASGLLKDFCIARACTVYTCIQSVVSKGSHCTWTAALSNICTVALYRRSRYVSTKDCHTFAGALRHGTCPSSLTVSELPHIQA